MILILQHGEHETAGCITDCLERRNLPFGIIRLFEGDKLPEKTPSHLIILGGQMSVNDEARYLFFKPEKKFVRTAVRQGKTVLGICLGAQLIASAFSMPVYRSQAERGWKRIRGCAPGLLCWHPEEFPVFTWHQETFHLPGRATLVAYGDEIRNQAFLLNRAVGVQFHPEVTMPIIRHWAKDLPGPERIRVIQESERLIGQYRLCCDRMMDAFLVGWRAK